jgi:N-acetylglucosaminyldiphosphoundecaprenol N-acetyl-beta-D-mannosaminyltransferase
MTFQFDRYDLDEFTDVASRFGQDSYAYVVTPNADHLIRLHEDAAFRALYAQANYVLLDSRFIARILRVAKGITLPVCTGSDLTAKLFADVIEPDDPLVLIGGSAEQAQKLAQRYGLRKLAHFNPPMGFIRDPVAVEECLRFVESHSPFRFCLLAVGAPQQEAIAQLLKARGNARGMALCIGASINFLTGEERRAPLWMQHAGVEWLYRLLQAPDRMARRYLVRGPRVFGLLRQAQIVLRPRPTAVLRLVPASQDAPQPALHAVVEAHVRRIVREA